MKITKMLRMTRSHILRVVFCSIVTMGNDININNYYG